MKTVEIIKLLDKDANKYGGTTGKERELNLSINGDFVGSIESAKLDGWGDGLVTDVTLEVQVSDIDYHDKKIREKTIKDFMEKLKEMYAFTIIEEEQLNEIAKQLKVGNDNE